MGLLDAFFKEKSYANKLIDKLGFEDASIALYGLIINTFDKSNQHIMYSQMEQFVRDEFDAASRGCDYSIKFVKNICPDRDWYKNVLTENSDYPIDYEGGPQQLLQSIIVPFIKENADLAVKLRCHIVEMIYEDLKILGSEIMSEISPISAIQLVNSKKVTQRLNRFEYLVKNGKLNV